MLKEFKSFLLRGNVVDRAVAVVIGTAFGAVVTALVADILTPIIAAIFGKPDFSSLTFTINNSVFRYGSFLNALIAFVSIAAAVFFFVVQPVNALMRPSQDAARRRLGYAGVPGVPERHSGRGAPLRLLHGRGGVGPRRRLTTLAPCVAGVDRDRQLLVPRHRRILIHVARTCAQPPRLALSRGRAPGRGRRWGPGRNRGRRRG